MTRLPGGVQTRAAAMAVGAACIDGQYIYGDGSQRWPGGVPAVRMDLFCWVQDTLT